MWRETEAKAAKRKLRGAKGRRGRKKGGSGGESEMRTLPDRFPPKNFPVWNPRLPMLGKSAVKQCKRKRRKSSCGVVFIITDYFISKCLSSAACFFFCLARSAATAAVATAAARARFQLPRESEDYPAAREYRDDGYDCFFHTYPTILVPMSRSVPT